MLIQFNNGVNAVSCSSIVCLSMSQYSSSVMKLIKYSSMLIQFSSITVSMLQNESIMKLLCLSWCAAVLIYSQWRTLVVMVWVRSDHWCRCVLNQSVCSARSGGVCSGPSPCAALRPGPQSCSSERVSPWRRRRVTTRRAWWPWSPCSA